VPERQHHRVCRSGNGILTPRKPSSPRPEPFRLIVDSSGNYLMVLDHDAPDNASRRAPTTARAPGRWDHHLRRHYDLPDQPDHRRLSLVVNAQVTASNGSALTYFPFPPIHRFRSQRPIPPHPHGCIGAHLYPYTAAPRSGVLISRQRPVDAEPEQCAAVRHPSRQRHCECQ